MKIIGLQHIDMTRTNMNEKLFFKVGRFFEGNFIIGTKNVFTKILNI